MHAVTARRRAGLTLIELLMVIAIIGILAVAGIGSFASNKGAAIEVSLRQDVLRLAAAQEAYRQRTGGYLTIGSYVSSSSTLNFTASGANVIASTSGTSGFVIEARNADARRSCSVIRRVTTADAGRAMTCATY